MIRAQAPLQFWALGIAAALNLGFGWWLYASFGHFFLALLVLIVTVPMALIFVFFVVPGPALRRAGRRGWTTDPGAWNAFLACCIVVGGFASSFVTGLVFRHIMTADARRWCIEHCVPAVEAYYEEHGSYPEELATVIDVSDGPRMAQDNGLMWFTGGDYYCFDISTGFFSGWAWDNRSRAWHPYD